MVVPVLSHGRRSVTMQVAGEAVRGSCPGRSPGMTRVLLPLLVLVLVACADPVTEPGTPGDDADPGVSDDADPGATGEAGSGGGAPATDPESGEELLPATCPGTVTEAVGATIDAQLAAFSRGDFPAALAEASPGFQAGTDPAAFRALIEQEYPLLLEDASAEVEGCAQLRPELSDVVAVIATGDGTRARFLYRLRLVDERWGIEAAARLDPPPATA